MIEDRVTGQKLSSQLADIAKFKKFNFNGDGTTDNVTAFTNLVNAYPNGALVYVPTGNYYISDENQLPHTIQRFEFIGMGDAIFTFGKVCGENTYTVPSASNVPNWKRCKFRNITFSAPNATGYAIFTSGSDNLKFYQCTISDVKPHFQQGTGDVCIFHDCKFIAPSTAAGTCLQTIGNVTQRFIVENCDWNFAPNQGAGSLIACTNQGNLIGDYWFINNRFFTDQLTGYYIDAVVDLEPSDLTNPLRNVHVEGNTIFNGKIYFGGVEELWIKDNLFHLTPIFNGASSAAIQGYSAYVTTTPTKYVEISGNVILCDENASWTYKEPIHIEEKTQIERLLIKNNVLQANGQMNASPQSVIAINSANGTINYLDIVDNQLHYTSVPSSKESAIWIITYGTGTVNHVKVQRNTLGGSVGACTYSSARVKRWNEFDN
jgi:hypothetical protein